MIVFLTGASGVGKTTIVQTLKQGPRGNQFDCYHFDEVGVPSKEEVRTIKDWQEKTTYLWIDKLVSDRSRRTIIIEGSVNISFILSGFKKQGYEDFMIFLIDCNERTMIGRLKERNQPELADVHMLNWLAFLRQQAIDYSIPSIDTTTVDPEHVAAWLIENIEQSMDRSRC